MNMYCIASIKFIPFKLHRNISWAKHTIRTFEEINSCIIIIAEQLTELLIYIEDNYILTHIASLTLFPSTLTTLTL